MKLRLSTIHVCKEQPSKWDIMSDEFPTSWFMNKIEYCYVWLLYTQVDKVISFVI